MKRVLMMRLMAVAGIAFLPSVSSALQDNHPYKPISARNVFSLVAPPPPAPIEPPKPPANIKLTGISTLRGDKKALLMVQDTSGPGKAEQSVILREGERDGQVEVVRIDVKEGAVKIRNAGVDATLTFVQNGNKLPPLPVAGGALAQPPNVIPAPARGGSGPSPTMTAVRQIPTRPIRANTLNAPMIATPAMSQQESDNRRLEQQILMETSRAMNPDHPPLPPTDLGDLLNEAAGSGGPPAFPQ